MILKSPEALIVVKVSSKQSEDADDAATYAWAVTEKTKRSEDADDAVAYAWAVTEAKLLSCESVHCWKFVSSDGFNPEIHSLLLLGKETMILVVECSKWYTKLPPAKIAFQSIPANGIAENSPCMCRPLQLKEATSTRQKSTILVLPQILSE